MFKTSYHISQMDCPSEESLIRMKLENIPEISSLDFDLENRILFVYHSAENPLIQDSLAELKLGCKLQSVTKTKERIVSPHTFQKKLLWIVLIINLVFFIVEMITGIVSKSMGLVADSLDMFADAVVYGMSLWVVGLALSLKKIVAKLSGYFQIILALVGFVEIVRRVLFESALPNYSTMIFVSFLALIANAVSMFVLNKTESKDINIMASKIFTSNDIIINIGVIIAGILVMLTNSQIPDLIIGTVVFMIVIRGAIRILKLA